MLAAIIDLPANRGYAADFAIGRKGGRRLSAGPGPLHRHRLAVLAHGEPFFGRHGARAVFLGRWVSGLRIASAWPAGVNRMPWPGFPFRRHRKAAA